MTGWNRFFLLPFLGIFFASGCEQLNAPLKEDIEYNLSVHPITSGKELADAIAGASGGRTFTVMCDITIPAAIAVNSSKAITLEAYRDGRTVHIRREGTSALFTVIGGRLTLGTDRNKGTLILDGGGVGAGGLINIGGSSAHLTLNRGAELRNGAGTCGAVSIDTGGTFTMNGGVISRNTATGRGAVHIAGGTFIMNGGAISGNTAASTGGGVYITKGTFTMTGGAISGNTALGNGGGVFVTGNGTSFIMRGGTISKNISASAGDGVYADSGLVSFTMSESAVVTPDNAVSLGSGARITLSGALTANPAANINMMIMLPGIPLLYGDTLSGNPPNYQRFLINGDSGKIGADGKSL
jgi:hypothetical protein